MPKMTEAIAAEVTTSDRFLRDVTMTCDLLLQTLSLLSGKVELSHPLCEDSERYETVVTLAALQDCLALIWADSLPGEHDEAAYEKFMISLKGKVEGFRKQIQERDAREQASGTHL